MVAIPLELSSRADVMQYGFARLPSPADAADLQYVDKVPYGRFRNVYLYITEACQLRCKHCYMGERLDRAVKMPIEKIRGTLQTWRKMGGSKLTILGGEPTLHPDFVESIRAAHTLGYEHVIITTNGLNPCIRKLRQMEVSDFSYVQVSLDGGSSATHDMVRGEGTFDEALVNIAELCSRGFDTRIICTVNSENMADAFSLMQIADEVGASLVKYHVFSTIGTGSSNDQMSVSPRDWIDFCRQLEIEAPKYTTRVWYQPTYAFKDEVDRYAAEGYRGCIGRTLDRISIFPDGRCYVCSYMFDTNLHFAEMHGGHVQLNSGPNEFDLFTRTLCESECGNCKSPHICQGGCPAERLVMGDASCASDTEIVPVCRLWKSDAK